MCKDIIRGNDHVNGNGEMEMEAGMSGKPSDLHVAKDRKRDRDRDTERKWVDVS